MKRKPKCGVGRKPVHQITDRAKRYRANHPACKPFGPRRCNAIINGGRCGSTRNLVRAHKDGDESNTRRSNLDYRCKSCNTREGKRDARIGRGVRTRQFNPGAKTLGEYVQAAVEHTRGAHDAGGKVIHETPKGKRKSFAREIAFRKAHKNPKRKKNPPSSADLYKQFHGRAGRRVTDFPDDADYNSHKSLAQLGIAVSLYVGERVDLEINDTRGITAIKQQEGEDEGWCVQIKFHPRQNPPHVASEPSGRQIYFVGGNQDISEYLPKFHVDIHKDLLDLGPCMVLEYHAEKGFDQFKPQVYFHCLGEESGGFPGDNGLNPRLMYNRVKRRLYLLGGSYRIKPEGIVD